MLRIFIILGHLCVFWSSQAEASTYRYEFDVVDSDIFFDYLGNGGGNMIDDAEYDAAIAAFHRMGSAIDQTGSIVLKAKIETVSPPSHPEIGFLTCVSGFLCSTVAGSHLQIMPVTVVPDSVDFPIEFRTTGVWPFEWSLSGSTLRIVDNGDFGNCGTMDGSIITEESIVYCWFSPVAEFTLANLTITEIAPVPLPASAPLLAIGLLVIGIGARRRARAT